MMSGGNSFSFFDCTKKDACGLATVVVCVVIGGVIGGVTEFLIGNNAAVGAGVGTAVGFAISLCATCLCCNNSGKEIGATDPGEERLIMH